MKTEDIAVSQGAGFKMVCDDCGSLSIKAADFAHASLATLIQCGRCSAVRGTLSELHVLARRSSGSYEF